MGKLSHYLNKARKNENLKRHYLNKYVEGKYLLLSHAFIKIKKASEQTQIKLKKENVHHLL